MKSSFARVLSLSLILCFLSNCKKENAPIPQPVDPIFEVKTENRIVLNESDAPSICKPPEVVAAPGYTGCCCVKITEITVNNWLLSVKNEEKSYEGNFSPAPNARRVYRISLGSQVINQSTYPPWPLIDCLTETWYTNISSSVYFYCPGTYTFSILLQYKTNSGTWATCSSDSKDFYVPFNPNYPCF
jgi:hypothetical protein